MCWQELNSTQRDVRRRAEPTNGLNFTPIINNTNGRNGIQRLVVVVTLVSLKALLPISVLSFKVWYVCVCIPTICLERDDLARDPFIYLAGYLAALRCLHEYSHGFVGLYFLRYKSDSSSWSCRGLWRREVPGRWLL